MQRLPQLAFIAALTAFVATAVLVTGRGDDSLFAEPPAIEEATVEAAQLS